MMYVLYGSDTDKARTKLHELVGSLLKKKPDASHEKMTDEDFSESRLQELIGGMGLFSEKAIVEMHTVLRNKEAKEIVMSYLKEIAASENVFVFLEGELNKTDKTKFEKNAVKVQEFELKTKAEVAHDEFKIFALSDAFGRRDKKQMWVVFNKAKKREVAVEEIHGILFWQVKAMLLASKTKSPTEAGLNPFVFQKSKGFLQKYSEQEVTAISSKLVSMYHDAHRGLIDFDIALEKFILEV